MKRILFLLLLCVWLVGCGQKQSPLNSELLLKFHNEERLKNNLEPLYIDHTDKYNGDA